MFLEELTPVVKEFFQQPLAFCGGFVSGVLRLNLSDEPLKNWLQNQGINTYSYTEDNTTKDNRPQSITID